MRKTAALLGAIALAGCAHGDAGAIANTFFVASIIAIEVAAANPPPPAMCQDGPGDPPHTCPGTAAGPIAPPPPPPEP